MDLRCSVSSGGRRRIWFRYAEFTNLGFEIRRSRGEEVSRKIFGVSWRVDSNFVIKNIGIFDISGWWDINSRSEEIDKVIEVLRRTKCLRYSHAIKVTAKLSFASIADRSPVAQCYANTCETISNRYEIETIRNFVPGQGWTDRNLEKYSRM